MVQMVGSDCKVVDRMQIYQNKDCITQTSGTCTFYYSFSNSVLG